MSIYLFYLFYLVNTGSMTRLLRYIKWKYLYAYAYTHA